MERIKVRRNQRLFTTTLPTYYTKQVAELNEIRIDVRLQLRAVRNIRHAGKL